MASKQSKKITKGNAKVSGADFSKYSKRLSVVAKKKAIIGAISAAVVLGGAAGVGGYFISKSISNSGYVAGGVYIDPSKQSSSSISGVNKDAAGNQTIYLKSLTGNIIANANVTIGNDTLSDDEFKFSKATESNGTDSNVWISVNVFKDHGSGIIFVTPIYTNEMAVVVFNSNGGTQVDVQQVKFGSKVTRPTDPEKKISSTESYEFGGWYTDENLTKEFDFENTTIDSNINLYAKWNIPTPEKGILSYYYDSSSGGLVAYCNKSQKENLPTYLRIPEKVDGIDVVGIGREKDTGRGDGAFSECQELVEVSIPKTVKWIDKYAFAKCNCLKKVNFEGDNVTSIGYGAFEKCKSLTDINLQENLLELGQNAFKECTSLNNIVLPDTLYVIPNGCFVDCTGLRTVTLGQNVTTIGDGNTSDAAMNYEEKVKTEEFAVVSSLISSNESSSEYGAFEGCSSLKNISIPESVTSIGAYAFYDCDSLTKSTFKVLDSYSTWYSDKGTIYKIQDFLDALWEGYAIKKNAIECDEEGYEHFSFQYSGKELIDGKYHYYCTISLNSYPEGSTSEVTTIKVPEVIHYSGLLGEPIELEVYKIADEGFYVSDALHKEGVKYNVQLPSTLEYIGARAFAYTNNIYNNISFENNKSSLVSVGDYAFYYAHINRFNSTEDYVLNIPEGVKKLGNNAFANTYSLSEAHLPSTLLTIPTELSKSSYISSVESVIANKASLKIPEFVFSYPFFNSSIYKVYVDKNNPYYMSDDYGNLYTKNVNDGSYEELISCTNYAQETTETETAGVYKMPDSVTSINDIAFANWASVDSSSSNDGWVYLNKVELSDKLETIDGAFYYYKKFGLYCSQIWSSTITFTLNDLSASGNFKFDSTNKILYGLTDGVETSLVTSLNYIEDETVTFTIPNTILTISNGAFLGNGYSGFTFEDNSLLQSIGSYAFALNTIQEINIPQSVKEIGSYAFYSTKTSTLYVNSSWLANISYSTLCDAYCLEPGTVYLKKSDEIELGDDSFLKYHDLYVYDEETVIEGYKCYRYNG